MGRNNGTDIAYANVLSYVREPLLNSQLCLLRFLKGVGMADKALAVVFSSAAGMGFHGVHRSAYGVFPPPYLIVGDDLPLAVQPHDRAYIQDGGDGRGCAGYSSAAAEVFQIHGLELMMHRVAVFPDPIRDLVHTAAGVPHIRSGIHQ